MKLTVEKRTTGKKGETNKLRREGSIPAIIYGLGEAGTPVSVKREAIQQVLQKVASGHLATTVFELEMGSKTVKAIVKDVQYHPANYAIEHIDFLETKEDHPVTLNVPIQMEGVADCAGVKLGGFLRQVIRTLKVECLPKDIPAHFSLDVLNLSLGQSRRLSDLTIPKGVRPLAKMEQVIVVIGKKAGS